MQNQNQEKKDAIKTSGWGQGSDLGRDDVGSSDVRGVAGSDLRNRVMSALNSDSNIDASNITINMRENNMIELCGTVPESSMIQRAEECVRRVEGFTGTIDNDLKSRMS